MTSTAEPAARQGLMNVSELESLARAHASRLTSFLRRRVSNPHDVEDLLQDTMLEAFRCMGQYRGHSRPETWLFGIALNLTRNHHKRARVRDIFCDVDADEIESDPCNDPSEIAEHRERMIRVASAAEQLPGDSLRLLQLVIDDDLSYDQVALELGIPTGTVRSRISRVRAHLKRRAEHRTQDGPLSA